MVGGCTNAKHMLEKLVAHHEADKRTAATDHKDASLCHPNGSASLGYDSNR